MQITNTDQTLLTEKENMATQRFPLHSEEFTYISVAKKIPHNGLWNKVLNSMNSLISMILVRSYQNDYRSRRVTEICKGRTFCGDRTVFTNLHANKAEFKNLYLTFKPFFTSPFTLSSVLVSSHSLPFWVFVLHLCFLSPAHTSYSLALLTLLCTWNSRSPKLI